MTIKLKKHGEAILSEVTLTDFFTSLKNIDTVNDTMRIKDQLYTFSTLTITLSA